MITSGEYFFFDRIKDDCNVIFDIGVRDDVHYVSLKQDGEFHLFEPNTEFYKSLLTNLNPYMSPKIISNNFGLGSITETITYYHNTQSFTKLITNYPSDPNHVSVFNVVNFKEYIAEKNIKIIDFMKIDTEGYEIDVIFSDIDYIKSSVRYIQFEYSSAWLSKKVSINLKDLMNEFDGFDFYLVKDDNHPISSIYDKYLTEIYPDMTDNIDSYMSRGYGFNIAMIQKSINYDNN